MGSACLEGAELAVSCEKPSGSELLWWATFGKNWEENGRHMKNYKDISCLFISFCMFKNVD